MKKFLALLFLLPGLASAASITVNWTNPTTAEDGTALTGAQAITAVKVYLSTATIADTSSMAETVSLPAGTSTTTQTFTAAAGQTIFVRVKVCNAAGCSVFSNQASKLV